MRRVGALTVYEGIDEIHPEARPSVATIGVFDGVHRGHRALVRRVVERAGARAAVPAVVTFDRHPLEVVAPAKAPQLLTTLPQRARLLEAAGVRALVVLRFDDGFRHMPPDDFVRAVLVDGLGCIEVVVGADFRFGYRQAGTIETLADLGRRHGFDVTIFALVAGDGEKVSSTMIRAAIADGDVGRASEALGHPYRLDGVVERGAGRGRGLGFPTANLRVPERVVLPKIGVYAGWMIVAGERYEAAINVGVNPTFEDRTQPIVEAFLIDVEEIELYGEVVEVEFAHRLRDEVKFPDAASLARQIQIDVRQARELLNG